MPDSEPAPARLSLQQRLNNNTGRMFHALSIRNYRLYWIAQVISLSGTWMQTTAQAWLVLKKTDSNTALGLVSLAQFLPVTILALFGGIIADRLPKRRTVLITQAAAMVQAAIFGFLVLTDTIQIWHIFVLAAIQGVITAVDNPVRQTFVVEMVGRKDLLNAVALNAMVFNGARIFGPSLAGIVIAWIGIAPTLLLNALSFIPVLWALLAMDMSQLHEVPSRVQGSVLEGLKEGLGFALRTPTILTLLIMGAALGTFGYNFTISIPLIAERVLKTDPALFGLLFSSLGLGSIIGALVNAYSGQAQLGRIMVAATLFSLLTMAVGFSTNFVLSSLILVGVGVNSIMYANASNALLQLESPDELRGRVIGVNTLLFVGSTPIGGLFIGALSEAIGVPITIFLCGLFSLIGVVAAFIYHRRQHPAPA